MADSRWTSTLARPGVPGGRDVRVDVLRGLALLLIFIDHIPGNPLMGGTLISLGLADAAELFVLLAGFSAALAYGATMDGAPVVGKGFMAGARRAFRRAGEIYLTHLALIAAVAGIVILAANLFQNPLYIEVVNIWPLLSKPAVALGQAALLRYQPSYLDILPLYVLLLALFPAAYWLMRRWPLATLALSFGLWAAVQATGWNLPTSFGPRGWFLNPLAWQFIYVLGLYWGLRMRLGAALPAPRWLIWPSAAVLAAGFVLKSPWTEAWYLTALPAWPAEWMLPYGKTDLAAWRVVYALALVHVLWTLVPRGAALLEAALPRLLADAGRRSLPVFALGVVLSLLGHVAVVESQGGALGYWVVSVLGCSLLLSFGRILGWKKSIRPAAQPVQESGVACVMS